MVHYAPFRGSNSRIENGEFLVENSLFRIELPPKANSVLRQRRISRYIGQKTGWVEDGFDLVINQFMSGKGRVSDYLRISYPNDMPLDKRRNDTGSERKTLLFRFRYMLKCFLLISDDYMEFVQWRFSLRKLASRCWKANADRFESLAKLGAEAGYPNKAAFAAALYRLAKRYPSADHFRWQA